MRTRRRLEALAARVRQHGVDDASVARAGALLDETGGLEAVEEPRHPGRREEEPLLDGREAMRTLETTLAVKESAVTGEEVRLS